MYHNYVGIVCIDFLALILALEPEDASLCCRQNRQELNFGPGIKYMVVDCGGGTVDIAVHEIDENDNFSEKNNMIIKILGFTQSKTAPRGGAWGSTKIYNNFKILLFEVSLRTRTFILLFILFRFRF